MKRAAIILLQVIVTAAGFWYVFHNPQRRAQIAIALRSADIGWVCCLVGLVIARWNCWQQCDGKCFCALTSIPISLGGLGVRETLFQELLGSLTQVPPAIAAFTASPGYAKQISWALLGGAVFLLSGKILSR